MQSHLLLGVIGVPYLVWWHGSISVLVDGTQCELLELLLTVSLWITSSLIGGDEKEGERERG